jgi:hypothetical protein
LARVELTLRAGQHRRLVDPVVEPERRGQVAHHAPAPVGDVRLLDAGQPLQEAQLRGVVGDLVVPPTPPRGTKDAVLGRIRERGLDVLRKDAGRGAECASGRGRAEEVTARQSGHRKSFLSWTPGTPRPSRNNGRTLR